MRLRFPPQPHKLGRLHRPGRSQARRRPLLVALTAAALAVMTLPLAPAPATADHAVSFTLVWIRCQDQNESFSDEPYVKVNGATVREFSGVETTETHYFLQGPRPFDSAPPWNGNYVEIQMWESDNPWSLDDYLGTRYIFHDAGPGLHELYFFSSQGEYILAYSVSY
ncbi:MAG TPA: hypothetical protein VFB84_10710 [Micromonosporaceae bacterium]|nr:hypothetical protein [Micromonosporaceae bacterium]